jgi:glycerol-3-phosphate acyltransferase PlsY
MLIEVAFIGGSYLFGALPFGTALARINGIDLSQEKDLHIALWHRVGKFKALLAGFVDFVKGAIPILIGFGLELSTTIVALCGVAAVAGQMWPPLHSGHGEKGNTPGVGVVITLVLVYKAYFVLPSLIPFAIGAAIALFFESSPSRVLPLGMLVGFTIAPIIAWHSAQPVGLTLGFLALLTAIVVRRLTAGLRADLKTGKGTAKILAARLIFDRSEER